LVECANKDCVTALREIGTGGVRYIEDVDRVVRNYISEQRQSFLRSVDGDHTFIEATTFSMGADEGAADDDVEELKSDLTEVPLVAADSDDKDGNETSEDEVVAEEVDLDGVGEDEDDADGEGEAASAPPGDKLASE
jgi:hypothetical protein